VIDVLKRAAGAGVAEILVTGTSVAASERAVVLCQVRFAAFVQSFNYFLERKQSIELSAFEEVRIQHPFPF
jgi:hypothetical protein